MKPRITGCFVVLVTRNEIVSTRRALTWSWRGFVHTVTAPDLMGLVSITLMLRKDLEVLYNVLVNEIPDCSRVSQGREDRNRS